MGQAVGIDLGTTNSMVSVMRRGVVETINIEGRTAFPSVISFRPDGTMLVGQPAKARMLLDPLNTISSSKRYMGDKTKIFAAGGQSLTSIKAASIILERLVDCASMELGEIIRDVVITVPAYFNESQKEDTKRAGELVGLNVLRLLPEPTAAAIAYGLNKEKDQTLMVYDLGGGTFDISILKVKGNSFNVIAVGGDTQLGGDDFDQAIVKWACSQYQAEHGIDILQITAQQGRIALQKLQEAAEAAKIELSESQTASISIPDCLGVPFEVEISLAEYNSLIQPLLQRTITCMKSALKDAGLKPDDIDRVVLVGGSTKNRAVRDLVAREIKEPYTASRVDEAVSHGAAIVAVSMSAPDESDVPVDVHDVTAHSLGVDCTTDDDELYFRTIIKRQTRYPCVRAAMFQTRFPMQTGVMSKVFRGEDRKPENNEYLGELCLPIVPPQEDTVPLANIFELDADGIIHFTSVQLSLDDPRIAAIHDATDSLGDLSEGGIKSLMQLINNGSVRATKVDVKT